MNTKQKAQTASGGLRNEIKAENKQNKNSKKNKVVEEKKVFGPSFLLPYNREWPMLETFHNDMIISEIKSVFTKNICDQELLKKRKKVQSKRLSASDEEIDEVLRKIIQKKKKCDNVETILASLKDESKIKELSKYFLIGVNSITRYLEKNRSLSLLMVCRSANPDLITKHLLCQSLSADVPACAVQDLNQSVSNLLGLKSVLSIGFKVIPNNPFSDLIDFIKDKIPATEHNQWIKLWKHENDNNGADLTNCNKQPRNNSNDLGETNIRKRKSNQETIKLLQLNTPVREIQKKKKKR